MIRDEEDKDWILLPTEGQKVAVKKDHGTPIFGVIYSDGKWKGTDIKPTHWMPLPVKNKD